MSALPSTLSKAERIYSKKTIDALFQGGRSHSLSAFPLRLVYMRLGQDGDVPEMDVVLDADRSRAQLLVSVPKRCFKHAVDRNRVKRQVREAYRRHKSLVSRHAVALALIWLDATLHPTDEVEAKVVNLLRRVGERLDREESL